MAEWSSLKTSLQDLHIVLNRQITRFQRNGSLMVQHGHLEKPHHMSRLFTCGSRSTLTKDYLCTTQPWWLPSSFQKYCPRYSTTVRQLMTLNMPIQPRLFGMHHGWSHHPLITRVKQVQSHSLSWCQYSSFLYMTPSHPLGHTWIPIQTILVSHGPRSTVCLSIFLFCHTDCTSGVKGIVPFNLVCLGLACAQGNGIFKAAKFNVSWSLLKDKDLKAFHSDMIHNLKDLPYEPFIQLTNMFSVWMAQEIARKGEAIECPLTKRVADELCESGPSKYSCF